MSLKRALLLLVVLVLVLAVVPVGFALERRLGAALEERTREDLAMAPKLLAERWSGIQDVRMMHAREVARTPGLAEALSRGESERALRLVTEGARAFREAPILVDSTGSALVGPGVALGGLVEATRLGEQPVALLPVDGEMALLSLAGVEADGEWIGAAGGWSPLEEAEAGVLSGLTRSEVVILDPAGRVMGSTLDEGAAARVARSLPPAAGDTLAEIGAGGRRFLAIRASMGDGATAAFLRDLDRELEILPVLRRTAAWSTALALLVALVVGVLFAGGVARPVGALADAADRFRAGDVDAPLPSSSLAEVKRVSSAFAEMRRALSDRLAELEAMNRELADRQERLALLQSELVQRERLAATGRLLGQLAHEIRNPVASVRNCLEVVRRSGELEGETERFLDMAVDELLRMHELAEGMLDLHRPRGQAEGGSCDPAAVSREVSVLVSAGGGDARGSVSVVGEAPDAAIPEDALKQVLLNLVLNAREAMEAGGPVEIVLGTDDGKVRLEVLDRGPGIPDEALPRIFDPFFTTKDEVQGVGLGLFTAEGLVRTWGGTVRAENREGGPGARFVVELPRSTEE